MMFRSRDYGTRGALAIEEIGLVKEEPGAPTSDPGVRLKVLPRRPL